VWAPHYYPATYWTPRYWPPSGAVLDVPIGLPSIDLELVGSLSAAVVAAYDATADVRAEIIVVSQSESAAVLAPSLDGVTVEEEVDVEMAMAVTVDVEQTLITVDLEPTLITVEVDQ
jgi:hypothetical protein